MLEIVVTKFRPHVEVRDSVTLLGFANVDIRVPNADGNGGDFTLTSYGLTVKLLNGKQRVDFARIPGRGNRSDEWFDATHPGSAHSRKLLTDAVFANPAVRTSARIVVQELLDEEQQERFAAPAATGTDDIPY